MPQNLRKLCRRGRRSVVLSLLIGLPVVLIALLAVLGSLLDAPDAPTCQPDVDYPADSYLAIRPEYASNLLESQNGRDYYLLFWWDDNGDLCARIVCGGTQLDAALTDLQYYTYGLDEQPPQQLVVRGMTAPLPDGIQEAAIREYNRLVEDGDASPESFTALFGSYCLDVTRAPVDVPYVVGVGALALLALVWMLAAGAARRRIRRQNDRTLAHTPPAVLQAADRQLPEAHSFPACGVFISDDFLYCSRSGLILLPRREIDGACLCRGGEPGAHGKAARPNTASLALHFTDGSERQLPWLHATPLVLQQLEEIADLVPDACAAARCTEHAAPIRGPEY